MGDKRLLASKTGSVSYHVKGDPGDPGPMGPMVYPAGEWDVDTAYVRTSLSTPMVMCETQYYVLNKLGTVIGINPKEDYTLHGNNAIWILMDKVQYAFFDVLFANFAKLASAVLHGPYMFSQYGVDAAGNPVETASGYKDFNPEDPTHPANKFTPNLLIDFLRGSFVCNDGLFKGNIYTPYKVVNEDNYYDYLTDNDHGTDYNSEIDLAKCGLNVMFDWWRQVEIQSGSSTTIYYSTLILPSDKKYLGCELNLYNFTKNKVGINFSGNYVVPIVSGGDKRVAYALGILDFMEAIKLKMTVMQVGMNGNDTPEYVWVKVS